jgi:hypothetical protein
MPPIAMWSSNWSDESFEMSDNGATSGKKLKSKSQEEISQRRSHADKNKREDRKNKQRTRNLADRTKIAQIEKQKQRLRVPEEGMVPMSDRSPIWSLLRLNVPVYRSDLFLVPPQVPVHMIEAKSQVTAELIDLFPIPAIEDIRIKSEVPQLLRQHPNQLESVWLPLVLVEILQPDLVCAFLARAEAGI